MFPITERMKDVNFLELDENGNHHHKCLIISRTTRAQTQYSACPPLRNVRFLVVWRQNERIYTFLSMCEIEVYGTLGT